MSTHRVLLILISILVGCQGEGAGGSGADTIPAGSDVLRGADSRLIDLPSVGLAETLADLRDTHTDLSDTSKIVPDSCFDASEASADVLDALGELTDVSANGPDVISDVADISVDVFDILPDVPETFVDLPDIYGELSDSLDDALDIAGDSVPDGGVSVEDFSFIVTADMRYFAGESWCDSQITAPATSPIAQEYLILTGTFCDWADSVEDGAIPMVLDGGVWEGTILARQGDYHEYKFLTKWPDTEEKWCSMDGGDWDCISAPNLSVSVACAAPYAPPQFFTGACDAMVAVGPGDFILTPGDIDPPWDVEWNIQASVAPDYLWYPLPGNHETETPEDMEWLRAYNPEGAALPGVVNPGPAPCVETTYSFDHGDVHFVMLNQYCTLGGDSAGEGDVDDQLHAWLVADLEANTQPRILVAGHEPAFPQPDSHSGRASHIGDSLNQYSDNRDRFWEVLQNYDVIAYLTGHSHNFSAVKIAGVWQVDVGHSRGDGDPGAPSTFCKVNVSDVVSMNVYRDLLDESWEYQDLPETIVLHDPDIPTTTWRFRRGGLPTQAYDGVVDTTISAEPAAIPAEEILAMDGDTETAALIRWDLSAIGPVAGVGYAAVTLTVSNDGDAQDYTIHRILDPWTEATTWQDGLAFETAALGSVKTDEVGRFTFVFNAAGRAVVADWIQSPSTNHGLIFQGPDNDNWQEFASSEASDHELRPELTVETHN
jgi:hypothetical protein